MPIVYMINENEDFNNLNNYWTISVYETSITNSFYFIKEQEGVRELIRYGPFKTLEQAESTLNRFEDEIDEVVRYGSSPNGTVLVFDRHPLRSGPGHRRLLTNTRNFGAAHTHSVSSSCL